jgi:hypothetical protein
VEWALEIGSLPGQAFQIVHVVGESAHYGWFSRVQSRTRIDVYSVLDCDGFELVSPIDSGIDPPQRGWYPVRDVARFAELTGVNFLDKGSSLE